MSGAVLAALILLGIALVFALVFAILWKASHRSRRLVRRCTAETAGVVKKIRALEGGTRMTVEYAVDGVAYKISENIGQYRDRSADVPPGTRRYRPYIIARVGSVTPVMYDPEKPRRAYLKENKGQLFYN